MNFRPHASSPDPSRRALAARYAFPMIMALAVIVRIAGIDSQNLWFDESYSYYETTSPYSAIVDSATSVAGHPPLFCVTLKGWKTFSGDSPAGMRLLSTLFNCLTIWLVYLILLRYSRPAALATAFLLAISPSQVHFANEIRMYAMLALFGALAMYSYQRSWDVRFTSLRFNILAVAAMALAFYSHMLGAFITVSLFLHSALLLTGKTGAATADRLAVAKRLAAIYAAVFVLCLPWVYMMVATQDGLIAGQAWREALTLLGIGRELGMFFVSSFIGTLYFNDTANWKIGVLQVFTAVGFFVTCYIFYRGIRRTEMPSHIRAMALVGPALTFLLVIVTRKSFELTRYLFFVTPFLFAAIAFGLVSIRGTFKASAAFALVIFVQYAGLISYFTVESRDSDHRPALNVIQDRMRPSEKLLVLPADLDKMYDYYMRDDVRRINIIRNGDEGLPAPDPAREAASAVWIAVDYRSRWFPVCSDSIIAADPALTVHEEWRFPEAGTKVRLLRATRK